MATRKLNNMAAVVTAILALLLTSPALTQQPGGCVTHDDVERQLLDRYQETIETVAIASDGGLVSVFVSEHGETWTITVTWPTGCTSILSAGEAWARVAEIAGEGT